MKYWHKAKSVGERRRVCPVFWSIPALVRNPQRAFRRNCVERSGMNFIIQSHFIHTVTSCNSRHTLIMIKTFNKKVLTTVHSINNYQLCKHAETSFHVIIFVLLEFNICIVCSGLNMFFFFPFSFFRLLFSVGSIK
jgi:hypothetical protein